MCGDAQKSKGMFLVSACPSSFRLDFNVGVEAPFSDLRTRSCFFSAEIVS